jgi:hypothetical protein
MSDKEKDAKFGQMDPSMRGGGKMTKLMAMEGLFTQMGMYMKVTGRMIRLMVLENILTMMELSILDFGMKIDKKELD